MGGREVADLGGESRVREIAVLGGEGEWGVEGLQIYWERVVSARDCRFRHGEWRVETLQI